MKKLTLIIGLLCLTIGVIAQQEQLTVTKVKHGEEPKVVMSAIKNDFPNAVSKNFSFLPAKLYGKEWNVQLEGDALENATYYLVGIKAGKTEYTAVYDKDGKLMSSKQVIENAKLPRPVNETIKKFEGWHIDAATELIKYNGAKTITDIYKIKIQKGAEHRVIFLDPEGHIHEAAFALF